ncbi:MAG: hypothetical protein ACKOX6_18255, partial [Bdellovibrio sp.]
KAELERENAAKIAAQEIKANWHKELKNDPKFGGENFARNVHKVDKLLNEFAPEMKKNLTERKAMLPPIVMRDMLRIAEAIYSTEPLVHGDSKSPSKPDSADKNDPLAFYT